MKLILSLILFNSSFAFASPPPAPSVRCSIIDDNSVDPHTGLGGSIVPFEPFIFEKGENGDPDDFAAEADAKGVHFKLIYDLSVGRMATFVDNGKAHILTASFPFLSSNQLSRVLFYVPFDNKGQTLKKPLQFDVECFN